MGVRTSGKEVGARPGEEGLVSAGFIIMKETKINDVNILPK